MCMTKRPPLTSEDKFFRILDRCKIDIETGCWNWQKGKNACGYGTIGLREDGSQLAHRVIFSVSTKTDIKGMCVCHTCDNPACCNPVHLFVGLPIDNVTDMQRKGRRASFAGARNGKAKLSKKLISEMRDLRNSGLFTYEEIGNMYGVQKSASSKAIRGVSWRTVS